MRKVAAAMAGFALVAACSSGKPDLAKHQQPLKPTFAPESTTTAAPATGGSTASTPGAPATTSTTAAPADRQQASTTDPEHDTTTSLDPPPPWADLVAGRLTRTAEGFELRIKVGGGSAPARTPDNSHTMNIASFYDVDGDGEIDYSIWGNVASGGWGSSYFDDVHHRGGYQERSGVDVHPEGNEVVFRFPLSHLGGASRFRWSVALEWGRYEVLGTLAAARDAMPDNDGAVNFPSS